MTKAETNKLDKLLREVVNARDNGICQYCGGSGNNVHHICGRRNRSVRWIADNCLLLCPLHHTFGTNSFHQDPQATMKWFEETYPERYAHINELKNQILKQDFDYYKNLLTKEQ